MIPGILRTVNKINAEKKVQKQCEIDKEQLVEIQAVFCRYDAVRIYHHLVWSIYTERYYQQ